MSLAAVAFPTKLSPWNDFKIKHDNKVYLEHLTCKTIKLIDPF